MKKTFKILLIICILISTTNSAYAMIHSWEAEEYVIKINNINEKIEKIDLVNFEECKLEETGGNYITNFEVVPLVGEDDKEHLYNHDSENYYIKQIVRYNYLSGRAKDDIEHTVSSGMYKEKEEGILKTYDEAREEKFKTDVELYQHCSEAKYNEFICVKTTSYKAYKIIPIKEISVSDIKLNKLKYRHDDLSNLKIGIRVKNEKGEYKTFISNENSMWMRRPGGKPIIEEKQKIIDFDYSTGKYKTNAYESFLSPSNTRLIQILIVTIILLVIVIALIILNIISKKKNLSKNK